MEGVHSSASEWTPLRDTEARPRTTQTRRPLSTGSSSGTPGPLATAPFIGHPGVPVSKGPRTRLIRPTRSLGRAAQAARVPPEGTAQPPQPASGRALMGTLDLGDSRSCFQPSRWKGRRAPARGPTCRCASLRSDHHPPPPALHLPPLRAHCMCMCTARECICTACAPCMCTACRQRVHGMCTTATQISIASDPESHDPWGQRDSPTEDDPPNTTTLIPMSEAVPYLHAPTCRRHPHRLPPWRRMLSCTSGTPAVLSC